MSDAEYRDVLAQFVAQCWRNLLELESANIEHYTYEQFRVHHEVVCGLYLTIADYQRELIASLCGERSNSCLSSSTAQSGATSPPTDP